ncbi:MAG: methyltransferase regulatory domain-containing protein [Rubrivivax sp.]|nr:methyltransferase regulatory domain-containing protein [Rubrivivax sp.]
MNDWNEGYITDVDYTYGFYKEMAPAAIRFALLAAGYESPPVDRFSYCELGYGQGAGLALLAAANPGGDFWGTDFNPAHAAGAARLAGEAGLKNLHVFDDSFEQFGQRDLPQFDYITLHGIWSWVGTEVAQQIVDFIRLHLKVGGVVYISYNTLPGWTHALPMRGLLSQYVEFQSSQADPIGNRLDGALKLLEDLNQIPGSYFHRTPQLAERIKSLQGQNRNYLAHEYLNRHWQPVFFSQMVEALTPAKLTFTAHAGALNCIDAVNHTKELQAVLDRISNPIFKEIVRDLGINQTFRRDLFVRGPRRLSRTDHAAGLLDTTYALVTERSKCDLKIKTHVGEANLQPEAYDPLLDRLASKGPTQGRALMSRLSWKEWVVLRDCCRPWWFWWVQAMPNPVARSRRMTGQRQLQPLSTTSSSSAPCVVTPATSTTWRLPSSAAASSCHACPSSSSAPWPANPRQTHRRWLPQSGTCSRPQGRVW